MKKIIAMAIAATMTASVSLPVFAGGNGAPNGQHYTVNFIGMPKNYKPGNSDGSGGSTIFMPLDTSKVTESAPLICTTNGGAQTTFTNDTYPTYYTADPSKGVKIGFKPSTDGTFDILDNDATDGSALIEIPVPDDADRYVNVDLYVRVLGKPGTCAEISGYAYDQDLQLWFWSGTIRMDRQTGKSTFEKATEIFDVWYCEVDNGACVAGTQQNLSVFDSVFDDYFWDLQNNGTRLIQMRFYPK